VPYLDGDGIPPLSRRARPITQTDECLMADQNSLNDPDPLNDPELDRLERQLSLVTLTPTPGQRERMLFACGQAAGRAQMMRRVRAATALAAVLACVSAGLCFALLTRDGSKVAALDPAAAPQLKEQLPEPPTDVLPREQPERNDAQEQQLTAATSFTQLLISDRQPTTRPSAVDPPHLVLKRVLTAAGPFTPDDRWE